MMKEKTLAQIIASVGPLDAAALERCQTRLDNLTKPLGSLHHLEFLALKLAGVTGQHRPALQQKQSILVVAADHGIAEAVCEEGKTTAQRVEDACRLNSPLRIFAAQNAAEVIVVNAGLREKNVHEQVLQASLALGTCDWRQGPALEQDMVLEALCLGISLAQAEADKGVRILGLGSIAHGGMLSALILLAIWGGVPASLRQQAAVSEKMAKRLSLVEEALALWNGETDAKAVLSRFGGLETAVLCGVILGGAARGMLLVLDGVETAAAALAAAQMQPLVKNYLVAPHVAAEPGFQELMFLLGLPSYLQLNLQQSEGIGAVLGMSLLRASLHMLNDMKTFGEAAVAVAQDGPGAERQSHAVRD